MPVSTVRGGRRCAEGQWLVTSTVAKPAMSSQPYKAVPHTSEDLQLFLSQLLHPSNSLGLETKGSGKDVAVLVSARKFCWVFLWVVFGLFFFFQKKLPWLKIGVCRAARRDLHS